MKKTLFVAAALAALSVSATAQVLLSTSFEAPTFSAGSLSGQYGWVGNLNYNVVTNFAKTGTQSVRWQGNGGTHAWKPISYSGTNAVQSKVSIYIDPQTANGDRAFGLRYFGESEGIGLTVNSNGVVRAADSYTALYSGPGVGTISNATGRWLDLEVSYVLGTTSAFVKVDTFSANITLSSAINTIDDVDFFSDWDILVTASSTAWFDDFSVEAVPEPATMTLLALGALAARRRKKA